MHEIISEAVYRKEIGKTAGRAYLLYGEEDYLKAHAVRLTRESICPDPAFAMEEKPDLLGGVTVIYGNAANGKRFTAIPLYAWDNRTAGKMQVWLKQEAKPDTWDTEGWAGTLYRNYEP